MDEEMRVGEANGGDDTFQEIVRDIAQRSTVDGRDSASQLEDPPGESGGQEQQQEAHS